MVVVVGAGPNLQHQTSVLLNTNPSSSPLVGFQPEGARKEVFAGGRLDPQGNYGTPTRVQRQNVPSVLRQQLTLLLCTRIREVGSEPEEQAAAQHHS